MALPKGKISKSRGRMRRANCKLSAPGIVKCPRCQQMKLAHRICKHCGYYDGKQVSSTWKPKPLPRSKICFSSPQSVTGGFCLRKMAYHHKEKFINLVWKKEK